MFHAAPSAPPPVSGLQPASQLGKLEEPLTPGRPSPASAPAPQYHDYAQQAHYPYANLASNLMRDALSLMPSYLEAQNMSRLPHNLTREAQLLTREALSSRQGQTIRDTATLSKLPSDFSRNLSNPSNSMTDPHNFAREIYNRQNLNEQTEAHMSRNGAKFMRNYYSKDEPNFVKGAEVNTQVPNFNCEVQNLMKRAPSFMKDDQYYDEQAFMRHSSNFSGEAQNMIRRNPSSREPLENTSQLKDPKDKFDNLVDGSFNIHSINGFSSDVSSLNSSKAQNITDYMRRSPLNIPQVPKIYDLHEKTDPFGFEKDPGKPESTFIHLDVKPEFRAEDENVGEESKNNGDHETLDRSPRLLDGKSRKNSTDSDHNFNSKPSQLGDPEQVSETSVKLEPTLINKDDEPLNGVDHNWTDVEFMKPFTRDTSGFTSEQFDVTRYTLVDKEDSWDTAVKEIIERPSDEFNRSQLYQCRHCALIFRHPKRYLVHHKWHTYGQINDRRRQHEEAKLQRRLARRKVPEKNYGDVGGTFKCDSCEMAFSTKQRYLSHKSTAHPTLPKECPVCLKMFPNLAEMKSHQKAAHVIEEEDKFMCDECPKTFKFLHSLVRHQATHMEKIYPCEKCDKKFGSELLVAIHSKTHERAERGAAYHCSYCGKGYHQPYTLAVHERGHSGERPFECHLCKSRYISNSSLVRHIRVSHQNESKPYRCAVCQRSFLTEQIRERHALRVHSEPADSPPEPAAPHKGKRRRRRARDDE